MSLPSPCFTNLPVPLNATPKSLIVPTAVLISPLTPVMLIESSTLAPTLRLLNNVKPPPANSTSTLPPKFLASLIAILPSLIVVLP